MKGVRALTSGMLVLALSCAIPAISAAQDAGTTTDATTTTTATTPQVTPPPADSFGNRPKPKPPEAAPTEPAAATQSEAAGSPVVTNPQLGRGSPGDGSGGVAHKSASASVTMGDFFFSPRSVTVAVGDTVTWRNNGDAPHNATADDGSFQTPDLNKGQSASETFNRSGSFSYICTIHPQMTGTVRVLSSGGGGGGGGASSSSSGSATSEASAVASPGAAGDANTLPMTGMGVGGLARVGFALLGLGLLARQADRERSRRPWLPIF